MSVADGASSTFVEPTWTATVYFYLYQSVTSLFTISILKLSLQIGQSHLSPLSLCIIVASLDGKTLIVGRLSVNLGASVREMARALTPEAQTSHDHDWSYHQVIALRQDRCPKRAHPQPLFRRLFSISSLSIFNPTAALRQDDQAHQEYVS